jgi:SAM-dependent methyltransferase
MSDDRLPFSAPAAPAAADLAAAAKAPNGADSASSIEVTIEDEPETSPKVPAAKPQEPPPSRAGETTRRRGKMTLKIPDDEISRPLPPPSSAAPVSSAAPTPAAAPPAPAPTPSFPPPSKPPVTAKSEPPSAEPPAVMVTPMRIITIEPPPVVPSSPPPAVVKPIMPRASAAPAPAPGTSTVKEDSWTPYQPTVADRAAMTPSAPPPTSEPRPPRPSYHPIGAAPAAPPRPSYPSAPAHSPSPAPPLAAVPEPTPSSTAQMPAAPMTEPAVPPSDSMDEIPIVTDESSPSSDEVVAAPVPDEVTVPTEMPKPRVVSVPPPPDRKSPDPPVAKAPLPPRVAPAPVAPSPPQAVPAVAASQPQVVVKDLPPMRALLPTEPEGLDVSFEEAEEVSAVRSSEPEAELGAEDLVSVESAPTPAKAVDPLLLDTTPRAFAPPGGPAAPARVSVPPVSTAKPTPVKPTPPRVIVPGPSPIAPPPMTDAPTGRRKARPWWEELFNDDFIRTMAKVSDAQIAKEADFVEESLAVAKGAMLLDLACGTGRHAIELTRRGYKVVGFDLSLPMLAKAAEEAQERGQKLNFVQGDMREMTFEDTFDGVYCWNTSFGFFEEDKNQQVVHRVHKALKKGGQLVLEVANRDYVIRQAPSLAWFEGDGCICMDEMSIDWITSRMKVKRTMMMDDGRTKEIDYSVRIYSLHELGKILHEAGFRVAEVSGRTGTPGVFFGSESPRTMILAEKK